jgi:hypothetical protein
MKWRIECKHSGKGHDFGGTFDDALRDAQRQCTTEYCRWVVWALPAIVRTAEVTRRGWILMNTRLTGQEVVALMRRHKKTIGGLAFIMGVSQKRIRHVRARGIDNPHAVRDWLEAITGEDPGPLPERYRIRRHIEEAFCDDCGCPLHVGDYAYEYAGAVYCSVTCCRSSRGWPRPSAA